MICVKILLIMASLAQLAVGLLPSRKASFYSRPNQWTSAAALNSAQRRLGDTGDINALNAQRSWWEWNYCTNAYPSKSFTPANDFVPDDTVFLAGFPSGLKSDNKTCNEVTIRTGEIGVGKQTIFFPLYDFTVLDFSDDYVEGICTNSSAEAEAGRFPFANALVDFLNNPNTTKSLFYKIDDVDKITSAFYLYDNRTYNLVGCADQRTYQEYSELTKTPQDPCDVANPFQKFNGLDAFPFLGWWGNDTRTWVDGEKHTYEFGFLGPVGFFELECINVKYVLTAKEECVGFCIFLWLRRLFRWLFSLL